MASETKLVHGETYHIYNRGTNRQALFLSGKHFEKFMQQLGWHIAPIARIYAYCLMGNHFHLVVQIRDEPVGQLFAPLRQFPRIRSQSFSNLFNAYAKWFNIREGRSGSVFEHPFHRLVVTDDLYFRQLICYVHQNPVRHGFVKDCSDWPWSSYHQLMSSWGAREEWTELVERFGGFEEMRKAHRNPSELSGEYGTVCPTRQP
jgi:putative transposase